MQLCICWKSQFMLRFIVTASNRFPSFRNTPVVKTWQGFTSATCSTKCPAEAKGGEEELVNKSEDVSEVLRKWGCSDSDMVRIFARYPALRKVDIHQLQSKLSLLIGLGVDVPDLVKIINCRPKFLGSWINHHFDEKIAYLLSFFGSKKTLHKAIMRNPSLLMYDFHDVIKPSIAIYEEMGVKKMDLITMILYRPTIISRTSFNDEKLEYIPRTGVSKDSNMYKYVVTLMGVSCLGTFRAKVANFGRFGFSEDEILRLFGRSPLLMTLSIEKVQRNMTFILGTMKLEAKIILKYPFLLYVNLDTLLKPRVFLARKIQDMGLMLQITGPRLLMALKMTEKKFLKAFVNCHQKDVADELTEFYIRTKEVKRLAESSKKCILRGFPF